MKYYPKPNLDNLPRSIVLANGDYPKAELPLSLIHHWVEGSGELICCDGAVNKLMQYTDRLPDAVVGDLDSVLPELRVRLHDRVYHFPDQDTNDLTKTMKFVSHSLGRSRVTLLGASGGREDHLLGNLSLLSDYAPLLDELVMITDTGYFRLLTEPSELEVEVGQQVSVFSFARAPITLSGVNWPLRDRVLPALWVGTLNRAIETKVFASSPEPLLIFVSLI